MDIYDREQLKSLLPHRGAALMLDGARYNPEDPDTIIGICKIETDNPHLEGHFPGKPIFPGHCIIECCNLAAAVLFRLKHPESTDLPYAIALDGVMFKGLVTPGDTLLVEVKLVRVKMKAFFFFSAAVRREEDGKLVAKIETLRGVKAPE
ncbi:beta-hydroxyacyl-ACP dehydratase [Patescibacteria group bacterium]|nr:MAG: beta-hydroxyacyl-ACP dehydratase [Patescibacteria group bacterium]